MTTDERKNISLSCLTVTGVTLVCNPSVIFESAAGSLLCVIILCFSAIWVSFSRIKNSVANSIVTANTNKQVTLYTSQRRHIFIKK